MDCGFDHSWLALHGGIRPQTARSRHSARHRKSNLNQHLGDRMKLRVGRCACAAVALAVLTVMPAASACISADEADAVRAAEADRTVQGNFARQLAAEADAIMFATAVSEKSASRTVTFRINRMLKGSMPVSPEVTYVWTPGRAALCHPSEAFFNTVAMVGETYILYASKGRLLRAGSVVRDAPDITTGAELELINAVLRESAR